MQLSDEYRGLISFVLHPCLIESMHCASVIAAGAPEPPIPFHYPPTEKRDIHKEREKKKK